MTTKMIDFDAFRAERDGEPPLKLTIGGRTYDLPPSLPAALALDVTRLHALVGDSVDVAEVDVTELSRLGAAIFGGAEQFHTILAEGAVTMPEFPDLLKQVLEAYSGGLVPNRAARRRRARSPSPRSRTGPSSRPTSSGSTGST